MSWKNPLLPVERLLFESDLVRIGAFRCAHDHALFPDSGPIRDHIFVFPRTAVKIRHEGKRPFVAGPNLATLYNRGQVYSREAVGGQPDRCDWFAVAPEILFDTLRQIDPASEGRQGRPFASGFVATTAPVYLRQRRLVNSLMRGRVTPLEVEEETIGILGSLLKAQVPALARQPGDPARGKVEAAKELIAERFHETLSLRQIAAATETSVYHLCRIFRQSTGFTIHEYRDQLRLRSSLEAVATADDLLAIAVDLNYSSHSHFTARFRRAFGVPPSVVRANS